MSRKRHRIPNKDETVQVFGVVHRVFMIDLVPKTAADVRYSMFSSAVRFVGGRPIRYTISMYCEQWQQHWIEPTTLRLRRPVDCINCLNAGA